MINHFRKKNRPAEKRCFRCGVSKPRAEFYAHPRMADGLLGKCKECARADVRANREAKREQYIAYERSRGSRPSGARDPVKCAARTTAGNALRDGRLTREPCEKCGGAAEAHHDDYSKPLSVRWLCRKHHLEHHGKRAY